MLDFKFTKDLDNKDNSVLKTVGDAMASARDTLVKKCDLSEEQAWDVVVELFRLYMNSSN
ncbi:MAG: hypothetical protein MJ126_10800 [Lachnospiraceae bacterium]|nr:hypothetical protein [Lachnospiraceae bacterium]